MRRCAARIPLCISEKHGDKQNASPQILHFGLANVIFERSEESFASFSLKDDGGEDDLL
jgi:hypothetical protein